MSELVDLAEARARLRPGPLLSVAQTAQVEGVSAGTVRRWVVEGCPCVRRGGRLLFDRGPVRLWRLRRAA
jgi:phage terminase Nu1 subunit (DNA packaging protein)